MANIAGLSLFAGSRVRVTLSLHMLQTRLVQHAQNTRALNEDARLAMAVAAAGTPGAAHACVPEGDTVGPGDACRVVPWRPGEARPTPSTNPGPKGPVGQSDPIKAVYITFFALGHEGLRTHAMELIEETELNAIVMDVKGDRGYVPYRSDVALAAEVGRRT